MNMSNFRAGLEILSRYHDKEFHGGAEHDQFYVYATDRPVTPEDVAKLVELGWFQEEADTGTDEDFAAKHYDPEEAWSAYF